MGIECEQADRCVFDPKCFNYYNCAPLKHNCPYKDFVNWIITLDDLDMLPMRRSLTLSYIIEKAKSTKPKD